MSAAPMRRRPPQAAAEGPQGGALLQELPLESLPLLYQLHLLHLLHLHHLLHLLRLLHLQHLLLASPLPL